MDAPIAGQDRLSLPFTRPFSIEGGRGEACVVAFLPNWFALQQADLRTLRRHLGALGVRLVMVSAHALWSFSPDEELERFLTAGPVHERLCAEARKRYRVGRTQNAVLLLDGDGVVRFHHVCHVPLRRGLIDALEACVRASAARAGRSPVDWLLTRLAADLSATLPAW